MLCNWAATIGILPCCRLPGLLRWVKTRHSTQSLAVAVCSARSAVSTWLHSKYCRGDSFARLPSTVDNPDQRMAADVGRWAEELGQLATVFAAAPLKARHHCFPHSLLSIIFVAGGHTHCSDIMVTSTRMLHPATGAVLHPLDGAAHLRFCRRHRVHLLRDQRHAAEVGILGKALVAEPRLAVP